MVALLLGAALFAGMCLAGALVLGWRQLHAHAAAAPVSSPAATAAPASAPVQAPEGEGGVARSERPVVPASPALPHAEGATSPEGLYAQALLAQQRGDALGCTQLAAAALRAGGSGLYHRTEGECYEALGDMLNALKAYERFCVAAPRSDPNRAHAQATVRAHHGRCD